MKLVDRIIFIIVGLFLLGIAAGCVLLAVDVFALSDIIEFLSDIRIDTLAVAVLFASAIILFVVALKLLFVRPKKAKIPAYTIHKSDDGEIAVSITAIENTIKLAMAEFDDIKDTKLRISVSDTGIAVSARVAVPTGIVIPRLLVEVKDFVKVFTESHTGVPIKSIKLTATEYKGTDIASSSKTAASSKSKDEKKTGTMPTHARIVLAKEEKTDSESSFQQTEEACVADTDAEVNDTGSAEAQYTDLEREH